MAQKSASQLAEEILSLIETAQGKNTPLRERPCGFGKRATPLDEVTALIQEAINSHASGKPTTTV